MGTTLRPNSSIDPSIASWLDDIRAQPFDLSPAGQEQLTRAA